MKAVMYSVPLSKLYRVVASCQYNENGEFCPVLVEIVDEKILMMNDMRKYLLQVWDKRGDMIFEKSLRQPVCNWNISRNKFIFQETVNSREVFIVRLYHYK